MSRSELPTCPLHPYNPLTLAGVCPSCEAQTYIDAMREWRDAKRAYVFVHNNRPPRPQKLPPKEDTRKQKPLTEVFVKGYQVGRYTVISQYPSRVPGQPEAGRERMQVRVRCVCGHTRWYELPKLRRMEKVHGGTGCFSRACRNKWLEEQNDHQGSKDS